MAEGGATCEVCGGLSFESSDGLFFCLECGTQSQVGSAVYYATDLLLFFSFHRMSGKRKQKKM